MKKTLFVGLLLGWSLLSWAADEVAIWRQKLPGFRVALDTSILQPNLFSLKVETRIANNGDQVDTRVSDAVAKLKTLPVTALVWSPNPTYRRVLLGDIVLSIGQAVPSYVFNDGRFYILTDIFENRLRFKLQESDDSEPVVFEIPFSFNEPLKNTSKFSQGGTQNDKK